ncbi:MAG: hypothetical protein KBA31_15525 [Alphaproteobacteria bacterium]|nr:hypothetical protein [Alphaproteobacteria bacterium]
MTRNRLQNWAMLAAVAALLVAVAQIYQTFMARTPANLEGNIAVEGKMTANPPGN